MDWAILGTVIGIGAALLGAIVTVLVLVWNMKGDIGVLLGRTEDLPQIRQNIKEHGEAIVALQDRSQPSTTQVEKSQPAPAAVST